jgi:hypothetical protein
MVRQREVIGLTILPIESTTVALKMESTNRAASERVGAMIEWGGNVVGPQSEMTGGLMSGALATGLWIGPLATTSRTGPMTENAVLVEIGDLVIGIAVDVRGSEKRIIRHGIQGIDENVPHGMRAGT